MQVLNKLPASIHLVLRPPYIAVRAAEAGESGQLSTLKCQASENIAFESRSIFLALEKIALEKESFVTSFGYMSIVIESEERGDS